MGFAGYGVYTLKRDVIPSKKFYYKALERWDGHQQTLQNSMLVLPVSTSTQSTQYPDISSLPHQENTVSVYSSLVVLSLLHVQQATNSVEDLLNMVQKNSKRNLY